MRQPPRERGRTFSTHSKARSISELDDRMIIAMKYPRYSSITLFFSLVLFVTGFHGASAETPGQLGTHPTTTDSDLTSTESTTLQPPPAPAAPQKLTTGQAPQPRTPTISEERFGPQVDPCFTATVEGDNWLDQVHDFVQDNTCEPAVWFDTFFVKDHVLLDVRPATLILLRNSVRWTEGRGVELVNNYRFRYRLPQIESLLKRAKFYIVSESPVDKFTTQPGQPVDPGVDRKQGSEHPSSGCEQICIPSSEHWSALTVVSRSVVHP